MNDEHMAISETSTPPAPTSQHLNLISCTSNDGIPTVSPDRNSTPLPSPAKPPLSRPKCGICFLSLDDGTDVVSCDTCHLAAHVQCSLLQPRELSTSKESPCFAFSVKDRICRICFQQQRTGLPSPISCELCGEERGQGCVMHSIGSANAVHICCARFAIPGTSLVSSQGAKLPNVSSSSSNLCTICLKPGGVTRFCESCPEKDKRPVHVYCALSKQNFSTHPSKYTLLCSEHRFMEPVLNRFLAKPFCGICLKVDASVQSACEECEVRMCSKCFSLHGPCKLCNQRNLRGEVVKCAACPHFHSRLASQVDPQRGFYHVFCAYAVSVSPSTTEDGSIASCLYCKTTGGHLVRCQEENCSQFFHPICSALENKVLAAQWQIKLHSQGEGSNGTKFHSYNADTWVSSQQHDVENKIVETQPDPDQFKKLLCCPSHSPWNESESALPFLVISSEVSIGTGLKPFRRSLDPSYLIAQNNLENEALALEKWESHRVQPPSSLPAETAPPSRASNMGTAMMSDIAQAISTAWTNTRTKPHYYLSSSQQKAKKASAAAGVTASATPTTTTTTSQHRSRASISKFDSFDEGTHYFIQQNIPSLPLFQDSPLEIIDVWTMLEPYFRRIPYQGKIDRLWQRERLGDENCDIPLGLMHLSPPQVSKFEKLKPCKREVSVLESFEWKQFLDEQVILFDVHPVNAYRAAFVHDHHALLLLNQEESKSWCHVASFWNTNDRLVCVKLKTKSKAELIRLFKEAVGVSTQLVIAFHTREALGGAQVVREREFVEFEEEGGYIAWKLPEDWESRMNQFLLDDHVCVQRSENTSTFSFSPSSSSPDDELLVKIREMESKLQAQKQANNDMLADCCRQMAESTLRMDRIRASSKSLDRKYLARKRALDDRLKIQAKKLQLEQSAKCKKCKGEVSLGANPILICEGSDCLFSAHQSCLNLTSVPEGEWFCDDCEFKRTGNRVKPRPPLPEDAPREGELVLYWDETPNVKSKRAAATAAKEKQREIVQLISARPSTVAAAAEGTTTRSSALPKPKPIPPLLPASSPETSTPPLPAAAAVAKVKQQKPLPVKKSLPPPVAQVSFGNCMCHQTEYVEGVFMMCCDKCAIWYHPECIHLKMCDLVDKDGHENCVKFGPKKDKHTGDLSNWRFKCPRCCRQSHPILQRIAGKDLEEEEEKPAAATPTAGGGKETENHNDDDDEGEVEVDKEATVKKKARRPKKRGW